mmetsp:Transcript_117814/g.334008  ORF Transcript_117814/g.334008 Transcript_117814/m.334008 type:complete len:261 (-) Transcript_117814:29-811(-)
MTALDPSRCYFPYTTWCAVEVLARLRLVSTWRATRGTWCAGLRHTRAQRPSDTGASSSPPRPPAASSRWQRPRRRAGAGGSRFRLSWATGHAWASSRESSLAADDQGSASRHALACSPPRAAAGPSSRRPATARRVPAAAPSHRRPTARQPSRAARPSRTRRRTTQSSLCGARKPSLASTTKSSGATRGISTTAAPMVPRGRRAAMRAQRPISCSERTSSEKTASRPCPSTTRTGCGHGRIMRHPAEVRHLKPISFMSSH